jgi:hypothetical protein
VGSISIPRKRKPLPISAVLVIAALCSGAAVVAIPAPHQPPGGFANAAEPHDPGVDPQALPSLRNVAARLGNGIGEVASAVVSGATAHH